MANSLSIIKWKNRILSELQNDDEIINALGLNKGEDAEDLIYVRLFPYYFIPQTQEDVKTYILVEIDIPQTRQRYSETSSIYSKPIITFTVLSHQKDITLNLIGSSAVRTDYIAALIDEKYNGKSGFGFKDLSVLSNTAGSFNSVYRYRQIVFEGVDLNDAICEV